MITAILGSVFFLVIVACVGIAWIANNRRRANQAGPDAVATQHPQRPKVSRADGLN